LIALATDKDVIDEAMVGWVVDILKYELDYRMLTDPIDADSTIAKIEENISRNLKRGPLTERELKQKVNANRAGLWAFNTALANLIKAREVEQNQKLYCWIDEHAQAVAA